MASSYNVLFLCTGNSARSIMAEALVTHRSAGRFRGFSAGSRPKGQVHPLAIETLHAFSVPADGLRSKSWDEFSGAGAPEVHAVITVCDNAANEACPVWPGRPATAHWGIPDPAAVEGDTDARRLAFRRTFHELDARITRFTRLRPETLDRQALQRTLAEIHHTAEPASDTTGT